MSSLIVSALLATLIGTIYLYFKHKFSYWKRRGVPFIKPKIPFGNFTPFFKFNCTFTQNLTELYNQSQEPIVGVYAALRPALLIRDPKIFRDIFIKDFQYFWHRGFHYDESVDPLTRNLFSQSGDEWKEMRAKLSPAFTSGKLKGMVETIVDCGKKVEECLSKYASSGKEVDVSEIFAQFSLNVIASVIFGLDVDCIENPEHEFRETAGRSFKPFTRNVLRLHMSYFSPFLTKLFGLRFADKDVAEFMTKIVRQNLEYREKNNIVRKDFFQLMIQLRNSDQFKDDDNWTANASTGKKTLSLEQMAAQAYIFLIAGYESSAATMSFCLHELAKRPNFQQKVYEEISSVLQKHNGKLNYEALSEMRYLECCIDETLRMHPPFQLLTRECTKDYKIADSNIVIEKGTPILSSIPASHYDSKYYNEPETFMPDRFIDDQSANKNSLNTPYLVFGAGPRNCIGLRLAKLQSKIGLCQMLRKFHFDSGAQHVNKDLVLNSKTIGRTPINGIVLKIHSR